MNRTRTLSLKRESLAELSGTELGAVAGGAASLGPSCLIGYTCLTCTLVPDCIALDLPGTSGCVPPGTRREC